MFKLYGNMHDKQLMAMLHSAEAAIGLPLMSPSGVRSRRSELSAPNMERIDELVAEFLAARNYIRSEVGGRWFLNVPPDYPNVSDALLDEARAWARDRLRDEGFRSYLWDTGERMVVDGRTNIVWGIAR